MFTITDICNIAVQIECNGERTYKHASEIAVNPQFSRLFSMMAEEERRHAEWFQNLKSARPILPEHQELEAMGKNLLQDMVKDQTFSLDSVSLAKAEGSEEILEQLITFERDTILIYEFLSEIIEEAEAKKELANIVAEENRHIEHLTEMVVDMQERKEPT